MSLLVKQLLLPSQAAERSEPSYAAAVLSILQLCGRLDLSWSGLELERNKSGPVVL